MTSEEPIFAPPIAEPVAVRTRSRGCGCAASAFTLLALATLALLVALGGCARGVRDALNQLAGGCCANFLSPGPGQYSPAPSSGTPSTGGAATPSGASPTTWSAPYGTTGSSGSSSSYSASSVFAQAFQNLFAIEILLSWGTDRAAENARRLEWIAQSLREYQQVHGHPPASLSDLRVSRSDLNDTFGRPVDYRVVGGQWEIRSAGRDGGFDANDPWLTGP